MATQYTLEQVYVLTDDWIKEWLARNNVNSTNTVHDRMISTQLLNVNHYVNELDKVYVYHKNFEKFYMMEDQALANLANAHGLFRSNMNRFDLLRILINNQIDPAEIQNNVVTEAQLLPSQIDHFNRTMNILNTTWYAYQDTSPMGAGKTFIVSNIGRTMRQTNPNISILIVSPVAVKTKWSRVPIRFGFKKNKIMVIGYELLAGRKNGSLNHPFLTRIDDTYRVTPFYDKLVKDGLLLVFDENQRVKNYKTLGSTAATTLVKHIVAVNKSGQGNSRIALLSASPGNEYEHTFNVMRMLGIASSAVPFYRNRDTGFQEVVAFARQLNSRTTDQILGGSYPVNKEEAYELAHHLYVNVIKPAVSSSAPVPVIESGRDYKNGFYNITTNSDKGLIKAGVDLLSNIRKKRDREEPEGEISISEEMLASLNRLNIDAKSNNFQIQTSAMMHIEFGKIFDLNRVATEILNSNPNAKVILAVNYRASIARLVNMLNSYNPLILTGDINKQKTRDRIIDKFQEPNNDRRLLIAITKVISVGLDLDDKFGNFPRTMLVIPDFRFLDNYQVTGRISRIDTKSLSTLRFFYSKSNYIDAETNEVSILESFIRKSDIANDLLVNGSDIKFPGEFDNYLEPN